MIQSFVKEVLAEDVGRGDLYALISKAIPASAKIISKSEGIFSGQVYADALAEIEGFEISWHINDGEYFEDGKLLAEIKGTSHTLLRIERTLLNMLLHASSISSYTHSFVEIIEPYGTKLLDTRKTRPKLRIFEKYATRLGGAVNHRLGLDDCLMLKDTHLKTISDINSFMKEARKKIPFTSKIEIEAESFEQAKTFMAAGADIVMCDNMTPKELEVVVQYKQKNFPDILLEASGNISLETIESYAKTGVDAISSGALIHQSKWIDMSMKMD
ncbi:carboxylating nicotinate-nucleotide diphosphorylase [Sulfurimonas sp. MAG313]|nr:carboxylating nicotinate-nucleotide diphosphorylase [Sulfurimonas sp. MAG313]MDF1880987.1 carboxylating nicotinate-nucleotide diphosphorylase [Sulfurimonas sp. MAG313]